MEEERRSGEYVKNQGMFWFVKSTHFDLLQTERPIDYRDLLPILINIGI